MKKLIVVSGASGAGKDTLVYYIEEEFFPVPVHLLPSTMTRERRPGDSPVHKHISPEFFELIDRGGGFLWTKPVHGHRYGTAKSDLQSSLAKPGCTVAVLTPDRLVEMRSAAKEMGVKEEDMLFLHVLSPSDAVLRERLAERGEPAGSIEARIVECRGWDEVVRTLPLDITYVTNSGTETDLALWVRKFLEGQ